MENNIEVLTGKKLRTIREWMDVPGNFEPGPKNSITDVDSVKVGHFTQFEGDDIRTGITIISPHDHDPFKKRCPCATATGNGFGKLAGTQQVDELGELESLIGLTNTLSVGAVMEGIVNHHMGNTSAKDLRSINVIVGETNDGYLNDIRKMSIRPHHVEEAIKNLSPEVEQGAVGAGTGTVCFGYKGGIGTSSRIIPGQLIKEDKDYVIGALVQSNYGGNLTIYGQKIPRNPVPQLRNDGSCMIIVATDAPVDSRQLKRFAQRGLLGLVNTGSYMSHGSGDFAISFSNHPSNLRAFDNNSKRTVEVLSDNQLSPFFEAVVEAVTEALYNSLTMSQSITGYHGHSVEGFNPEVYKELLLLR